MLLLDFSSLFIQIAFGLKKRGLIYSKEHLLNSFLTRVFGLSRRFRKYGDLYIFSDSGDYWRADIYSGYKRRRAERRLSDDVNWDLLHKLQNEIAEEISENLPFAFLGIERLEADDLIALACRFSAPKNKRHLILSSDKDLTQLLRAPNLNQYSIVNRVFLKYDPHEFKAHLLRGDSSDSVPSIYFDGEYLIKNSRGRRLTDAKLKEIDISSESAFKDSFKNDPEAEKIFANYNRNRLLIDLRCIPKKFLPVFLSRLKAAKEKARQSAAKADGYLAQKNLLSKFQAISKPPRNEDRRVRGRRGSPKQNGGQTKITD